MVGTQRFRSLILFLLALVLPASLRAQGTVSGQEITISYTGTNATLAPPNTPANNFVSPGGTNTFLLPIAQPAVSVRIYITNNTANACASTFTLQMFAVSDTQTSSFNNSLANWQTIPLQNPDGTLVQIATPNIPASGVAYVSSVAVAAPRVAVQLINANILNCPTTSVEVTATITPISLTSPLISSNSAGGFNSGISNQVQGVVTNGGNGAVVNPVVAGALANPINGSFLGQGVDNFNNATQVVSSGFSGPVTRGTVPKPSALNEWALAWIGGASDSGTATIGNGSPWGCLTGTAYVPGGCNLSVNPLFLELPNVSPNTSLLGTYQSASANSNEAAVIVVFKNTPIVRTNSGVVSTSTNLVTAATLSGSVMVVGVACQAGPAPCVSSLGSSLGVNYTLVSRSVGNASFVRPGIDIWVGTTASPGGADTITPTFTGGGAPVFLNFLELTGMNPSSLNQPNLPNQADGIGNQVFRLDAQAPNQFACSVLMTTNTTTTCQAAPSTINGVQVRLYVTDIQINTTVVGTASTVTLTTAVGCGNFMTSIKYPTTALGIQNIIGARTPLIAPIQAPVCVTQAGTVAATATVELRGFLAP